MRGVAAMALTLISLLAAASPSPARAAETVRETSKSISEISQKEVSKDRKVQELFAQSVALLKSDRAYEARALLERACQLAPRSASIHCNLGLAYQNSENIAKALSEFHEALKIEPEMAEALLDLAGCYQSIGNSEEAIKWYQRFIYYHGDAPQAKQVKDLITALTATKEPAGAEPWLQDYYKSVTFRGTYRWAKERMPLRVFVEDAVSPDGKPVSGYRPEFAKLLISAFDDWSKASGGKISCALVTDKNNCDIYCSFTDDAKDVTEAGTQSERGAARIISKDAVIQKATVKILTCPIIQDAVLTDDEIKKACLHEVGHVLGLQGHSTNNHDVMFFTVDTATVWPVLSKRDKATIQKLYP